MTHLPRPQFLAIRKMVAKAKARKERKAVKAQETEQLAILGGVPGPEPGQGATETVNRRTIRPKRLKSNRSAKQGKVRKPKKRLIKRGVLKSQIIRLLGLMDRMKRGNACRIIPECPVKVPHPGTLAYHLVPAQRGDATRFIPENVVWACSSANYGEVMNRSLYRQKHVDLFGKDLIEGLELKAREVRQYKMSELLELRAALKAQLEAGV